MHQIAINYNIIVVNFHQNFMAGKHSDFFDEHMEKEIIYWLNHSGEIRMSNHEEEV